MVDEFDLIALGASKLDGAFHDQAESVAVVVLLPTADGTTSLEQALSSLEEIGGYTFVPAGSLLLIEEQSPAARLFDIDDVTWTQLEDRPGPGYMLGSVVSDERLGIVITNFRDDVEGLSTAHELDLLNLTWSSLETLVAISVGGATAIDGDLTVAGSHQDANNNNIIGDGLVVFRFNQSGGWTPLTAPPINGQAVTITALPEGGLLAFNYERKAAVANSSGNWTAVDDVPMAESEGALWLIGHRLLKDIAWNVPAGSATHETFPPASPGPAFCWRATAPVSDGNIAENLLDVYPAAGPSRFLAVGAADSATHAASVVTSRSLL